MCVPAPPRYGLHTCSLGLVLVCVFLVILVRAGAGAQRIPDDLRLGSEGPGEGGCPAKCSCLGKYMECTNMRMRSIPVISDYFTSLDVSQNELTDDVHLSIGNRTKLKELNLNKNQLQKIPVFRGLGDLTKLQLAHNQIEVISLEALLALPKLTLLDLSKNRIKYVLPNSFPTTNSLANLNLNDNDIQKLENTSLGSLKHLVDLKLNQNALLAIPLGLFRNLKKLKRLDLSGNRIAELPYNTFSNLSKLRILRLSNNRLETLQTGGLHGLQNLMTLELDGNRLRVIQKSGFYNVSTLTTISLRNNSIVSIESNAWEFCQRLVNIDLSHNDVRVLNGSTFGCLDMLKQLNVRHNAITNIADGAFNCTTQLESLDLSENQISYTIEDINGPFRAMRKLNRLNLAGNRIKSVNRNAFNGLQQLAQLDLTRNNITSIQSETFAHLPALTELQMNTTNLLCDCNLLWFHDWLVSGKHGRVNVYCDYPSSMRGIRLSSLSPNSFTCNETPKPRIIDEPPPSMLAVIDRNASLTCSATSTSATEMTFKWKRDMVELSPATSSIVSESFQQPHTNSTIATSVLTLVDVGHEHVGRYQCVVSNSFGTTYSQKVKITVASFPKFRRIPANLTLNSMGTARLDCAAYGDPQPEIAWQKDGGSDFPAATERRVNVMPADSAFFIINAKLSDQGVYTCTAENPAGKIKANATLIVLEAPSFAKPMESKEAVAGDSSVVECLAIGSPKPSLSWLKDGHPIIITERHYFAGDGQLLVIVDTMDSDAGTYTCTLSNDLGTVTGAMQLNVIPAILSTVGNMDTITGIVIITGVCCAVATSIIWVSIIYHTRKGRGCTNYVAGNAAAAAPVDPYRLRSMHQANGSDPLSGERLNTTAPKLSEMYESQSLLCNTHSPMILPMNQRSFQPEYNYDDISCKDSGTGDSTKRSHRGVSMQNCTSDNDICCIEIDKTSASVSYKSSPSATVTPSSEDADDRFVSSRLSSPTQRSPTANVNIHPNKLNEILSHDSYVAIAPATNATAIHTHAGSPSPSTGSSPDTSSSLNHRSNRLSNSISIVPTPLDEQTVQ